jgi:hypothetical protein
MVKKYLLFILSLSSVLILIIIFPINADARINKEAINAPDDCVSLSELIDESNDYDGSIIKFSGEAIGNILYRGSYAWVNVSDANNSAIGIWMSANTARKISVLGHYGMHGDTLLVTGTFNRACPDHGGDPDIHAKTVIISYPGYKADISIPSYLPRFATICAICTVILCCFTFYRIRHYNT